MIIGITGGTGCGKTTALKAFAELGGLVLDCDQIYHQLLKTDKALLQSIEQHFPGTVQNGELDRKKLGSIVFSDEEKLKQLSTITHQAVKQEVLRALQGGHKAVAIDAIGLFEGGLAELCDTTVAVTAPEECRVSRLMAREGITAEYALSRIRAQRPQEEFVKLCQYRLHNDGTQEQFRQKCLAFFLELSIMDSETAGRSNADDPQS